MLLERDRRKGGLAGKSKPIDKGTQCDCEGKDGEAKKTKVGCWGGNAKRT
jgi:hypothetical protein